MKLIKKETNNIDGKQTLLWSDEKQKYFTVNTVENEVINKTWIVLSNKDGVTKNYNELYTLTPSDHEQVLDLIATGILKEEHFKFNGVLF